MFKNAPSLTSVDNDEVWDLLLQIKANTPSSILQQRAFDRLEMRVPVTIHPANASERHREPIQATSGDISGGGCQIIADRPLWVGDYYQIAFDRERLDIAPAVARCLRCRLVGQESFELGFQFNGPMELKNLS